MTANHTSLISCEWIDPFCYLTKWDVSRNRVCLWQLILLFYASTGPIARPDSCLYTSMSRTSKVSITLAHGNVSNYRWTDYHQYTFHRLDSLSNVFWLSLPSVWFLFRDFQHPRFVSSERAREGLNSSRRETPFADISHENPKILMYSLVPSSVLFCSYCKIATKSNGR